MKDKIMTFKSELKIKSKGLVVLESGLQDKNEKMTAMRTLMNRTVTQLDEKRETIEQEFWLKKEKLEEQLNQIKKSNEENLKELKAKAELQKLKQTENPQPNIKTNSELVTGKDGTLENSIDRNLETRKFSSYSERANPTPARKSNYQTSLQKSENSKKVESAINQIDNYDLPEREVQVHYNDPPAKEMPSSDSKITKSSNINPEKPHISHISSYSGITRNLSSKNCYSTISEKKDESYDGSSIMLNSGRKVKYGIDCNHQEDIERSQTQDQANVKNFWINKILDQE